jgi:hypothetical protein
MLGENNPNHGKKWNKKQRRRAAKISKEAMKDPEQRRKAGNANRGKKFSQEVRKRMADGHRGLPGPQHTKQVRAVIGTASSKKFTPEYREKQRQTFEERGIWIPLEQKSDWDIYKQLSYWQQRMIDLMPKEVILQINKIGLYKAGKNNRGLVRDHLFSRREGFELGVFPEILRHPANCQFITHGDNVRKRFKTQYGSGIPLEELCSRIEKWTGPWNEQEVCLKRIRQYRQGQRYTRRENPL